MRKSIFILAVIVVIVSALGILFFATGMYGRFFPPRAPENRHPRLVIPTEAFGAGRDSGPAERLAWEENINPKLPLDEGEIVVLVFNQDVGHDFGEEQIVAYRRPAEIEGPVYITCIRYDERSREYRRLWNASTEAVQSGTVSIISMDLVGDRNNCILVTGMNNQSEHTMTVFRHSPQLAPEEAYIKIAELRIDGSIIVQETVRSLAYQQGITNGESFAIAAYGHDSASANILDQVENIYVFNPSSEQYVLNRVTKIPGSQVEQRRLRELLSGVPGVFEEFINDLWYYVSPQGTLDLRQYVYFDPSQKEIIFFGDETQQIFTWQRSTPTRYGLYITSQNISISTLRRFVDIELESLDSIRLRVAEDVRLKITVSAPWDGSYKRARLLTANEKESNLRPVVDAVYDSPWGRLHFHDTGEYSIVTAGAARTGNYVFFNVNGNELLELRPEQERNSERTGSQDETIFSSRMTFRIGNTGRNSLTLTRVRLGTSGLQELHEGLVILNPVEN
ncbi:MAG: pallilysin-related adhesin [Treponema sp.]|nr:pallilysin-related adhesin [Treponema sp.]